MNSSQNISPTIYPLSEGSFTIDKTKLFVPFDTEEHELQDRPTGSLLVEIQPFLVKTSKDLLLLDTGLGFNTKEGKLQIYENIRKTGFHPEEVTKVLMSHLHKDHAGGITSGADANRLINFPNATYYIQRRELVFALEKGNPSFVPAELEPLMHSNQVKFLDEDNGLIDDYIRYEHTGGHSPYHQVFLIKDNGKLIFFGGDEAPQLQQMKVRYKTKYDYDPAKATSLRQQWWELGNKEGWTFLFYHDIKTPIYEGATKP